MKAIMRAMVRTNAESPFAFTGTDAQAVVAALKARQDIKAKTTDGKEVQIPFSAVITAVYSTEMMNNTALDLNCKARTPEADTDDGGQS